MTKVCIEPHPILDDAEIGRCVGRARLDERRVRGEAGNELVDVGGSEGGCVREAVSVAVVLGDVVTARGKAEREAKGRIRRDRSEEKRGWRMIMLTSSCEQRTHQRRRRSTRERG
jgi:hypothetical protein